MAVKLHVFVKNGNLDSKETTIMQGWEFPDVIVEAKSYKKAEDEFKKGVQTALRVNILESLEQLQNNVVDNSMNEMDTFFINTIGDYFHTLDSNISDESAIIISKAFLKVLTSYLEILSTKEQYNTIPPADTKEVLFV